MAENVTSPGGARSDRPASGPAGRVPPHSEEAERGVLGSALIDSERVIDLCLEKRLTPESFYVHAHRVLYETLVDMTNEHRPVDLLTVGEKLRAVRQLDAVGGESYLEQLIDSTPTSAHAEYYVDIVRRKHLLRSIIDRSRQAIESCYDCDDEADELLGETEQSFFEISDLAYRTMPAWGDLIKGSMDEIEQIFQNRKGITGVPTGFKDLDLQLQGLQPGDMIIIAARPSMGKTSLAMNIVEKVALGEVSDHAPRPVAVFSLEMSREQLVKRMICCRAKVSSHKLSSGYVSKVNHGLLIQAADALTRAQILLDDTAGLSALELRSRARRLKRKYDIQLIVVDYLQMMNFPQYAKEGRQRETAAISGALKAMAKELRVPVIVLSQLSRAPETRDKLAIPKLSDLRDSGSIEQDADVVGLLRRPCKYKDDERFEDQTLAILEIAKHRNGPTGEIELNFEEDFTRFADRARGVDQEYDYQAAEKGVEV